MDKNLIYAKLPTPLQNIACSLEGARIEKTRYGVTFDACLAKYSTSACLKGDALRNYQNEQVCKIVDHCFGTVPYYQKLFRELGITNKNIRTVDDLKILPILTRGGVKDNYDLLISSAIAPNKRYIHNTGGTTGSGLKFCTTHKEDAEQWAIWWRYRNALGIRKGTWCALLNGKVIVPVESHRRPYWRVNNPGKQVFFSAAHLNSETVKDYVNEMRERGIEWLHGYPTLIAQYAKLILDAHLQLPLKFVTVGSENITGNQERVIERAFCTKPYQHYGLTEGVANFSQYPDGKLRVDEDFSYVEFIPTEYGTSIIGTTFTNYAMPLLRYDTGDYAELASVQDDGFRIIERIDGRASDSIIRIDGSQISSAAISLIFNAFSEIAQAQIVQHGTCLVVKVVLIEPLNNDREQLLRQKFLERTGRDFSVIVTKVEKLDKTKNGKAKLVIVE